MARRHGISSATLFQWRAKFGGMAVSDMQRLRGLAQENPPLKPMVANLIVDHRLVKELFKNVWPSPENASSLVC